MRALTSLMAFASLSLTGACGSTPKTPEPTPADAPIKEKPDVLVPPVANKIPVTRTLHGDTFVDDYFWMREKDSAPVLEHLRAEADYAEKIMAPLAPLRDVLFKEIVSHIAEDDESVPVKDGAWLYWRRVAKGKGYPVFLRKPVDPKKGDAAVLLDVNQLAEGKAFLGIGDFEVDDTGAKFLYLTDETGFRQYDLRVRDIASGTDAAEVIPKVVSSTWAADGSIIYVVEDAAKRPYRAYRHVVGTDPKDDQLLFEETDGRFELYAWRTKSKAFIVLHSESKLATEVRLVDAKSPTKAPLLVAARADHNEYAVEHAGKQLIIRTNDKGSNFRLVTAPLATPGRDHWKELRAHDPEVMIEEITAFADVLAVEVREGGLPFLEVMDYKGKTSRIALPDPVYEVGFEQNPEFDTKTLRYAYQSLAVPRSVYSFDLKANTSTLLKEDPVPGGFDRTQYVTERIFATAKDGTQIPLSIVRKKDVAKDGKAPLHLYAYGSYGISMPTTFSPARLTLLDRGMIFVIAHIRGGGELGKAWHEAGRLGNKMNTFNDFIAAAETLIAQGYTQPSNLTIEGGSAGGLLMGAVLNLRPDLFKAAIVAVPFVDVLNTMNDPTLPLTITEYEEWGNPQIAEQYQWMKPYSPYENLEAKAYPTLLVKTSYNDSQVMYWEPAKYVARLRALKTDSNPVIFKIHLDAAGHGGKSGRYDRYKEVAYDAAFLLQQHGLID
jgi:oligopeptidase B